MVEIGPQLLHPGQAIADCLGEFRLAGDLAKLSLHPGFQIVEDRSGLSLPEPAPLVRRQSSCLLLNGVETGDALDRFFGNGRPLRLEHIDKLAADVG